MIGKDDNQLPCDLENMSIPELEALLQQDFIATSGGTPDADYIMTIMEVIQKKEQEKPDYQPLDAEKAWEEFQSFCNTEQERTSSICHFDEGANASKASDDTSKRGKTKTFRRCFLAAAVICLLIAVTCVPVLGYVNVIHMVAYWTADQFGFRMPGTPAGTGNQSNTNQIPEEYRELQEIFEQNGMALVVPHFPDDFDIEEPVLDYSPELESLYFSIMYKKEDFFIIFNIIQKDERFTDWTNYEKNDADVKCYNYNGVEYYTFSNDENTTISWHIERLEYYIVTNLSMPALKEILNIEV